jgi:hypothetical protein
LGWSWRLTDVGENPLAGDGVGNVADAFPAEKDRLLTTTVAVTPGSRSTIPAPGIRAATAT